VLRFNLDGTIDRDQLGQLEPFDAGAQATLYRCQDIQLQSAQPLLYKQYVPRVAAELDRNILVKYPQLLRALSPTASAWLAQRAAWPVGVVTQSGTARGVLIPQAPPVFFHDFPGPDGIRRGPAKVELLFNPANFLIRVGLRLRRWERYALLAAAADLLVFAHTHNIIISDLSSHNILFSISPLPRCYFIDCDSMLLAGHSALVQAETPQWQLPAGEPMGTKTGDRYKFALLALRMFTGAHHYYDPARLPRNFPPPIRDLVEHTLCSPPARRPLITEWQGPLLDAIRATVETQDTNTTSSPQTILPPRAAPAWTGRTNITPNTQPAPLSNQTGWQRQPRRTFKAVAAKLASYILWWFLSCLAVYVIYAAGYSISGSKVTVRADGHILLASLYTILGLVWAGVFLRSTLRRHK